MIPLLTPTTPASVVSPASEGRDPAALANDESERSFSLDGGGGATADPGREPDDESGANGDSAQMSEISAQDRNDSEHAEELDLTGQSARTNRPPSMAAEHIPEPGGEPAFEIEPEADARSVRQEAETEAPAQPPAGGTGTAGVMRPPAETIQASYAVGKSIPAGRGSVALGDEAPGVVEGAPARGQAGNGRQVPPASQAAGILSVQSHTERGPLVDPTRIGDADLPRVARHGPQGDVAVRLSDVPGADAAVTVLLHRPGAAPARGGDPRQHRVWRSVRITGCSGDAPWH